MKNVMCNVRGKQTNFKKIFYKFLNSQIAFGRRSSNKIGLSPIATVD